ATIPVVMYTSQEGELYLSQARALGAVGVLPKTVKQADVSKVLYQLRLLPERREIRAAAANDDIGPTVQVEQPRRATFGELETAVRNAVAPLLQEHSSEMRRFVLASLDSFARRLASEPKPAPPAAAAPEPAAPPVAEAERTRSWPLAAAVAGIALLSTLALAVLYTRALETNREILQRNAQLATLVEQQQQRLAAREAEQRTALPVATSASVSAARNSQPELVPYGEIPLSGQRLDRLRDLIAQLKAEGFKGTIKVATYTGEFCLSGNGFEGYSIAADELPFAKCDVVGNPFEESMSPAQRQSLAFANLLSSLRKDADVLQVEVPHFGRHPLTPYPNPQQDALTAGEWNKIAALNNRVEFIAEPDGAAVVMSEAALH